MRCSGNGAARAVGAVALAVLLAPRALAQPPQSSSQPRWSVEALAGAARVAPKDLNAYSRYNEAFFFSYYEALFGYYESAYRDAYTSTVSRRGDFPSVRSAWSVGLRVSRQVTPRVAATLELQYLSRDRSATVNGSRESTLYNPDAVSFETWDRVEYAFAPSSLAVRAYTPTAGLRFTLLAARRFRVEALAAGGAVRASSLIREERSIETGRYRSRSSQSTRMSGAGWGPAAEGGVRAAWTPGSRWTAFVEAAYRYQRVGNLEGEVKTSVTSRDGDASSSERLATQERSGAWRMSPWRVAAVFGTFDQPYPSVGAQGTAFGLDLSGVRFSAGLGFRLPRLW